MSTSWWRSSGRSILLIATIGLRPRASAFDSTNLVCGIGPFGGVDQHDRAVDHVEDALDLAAEIGVAGGVDDVDAAAVPDERGDLGEDGDAALALEVVGIHRALGDPLVVAEGARLAQQHVDQRGLAVIDVGDDGDVAEVHRSAGAGVRGRGI